MKAHVAVWTLAGLLFLGAAGRDGLDRWVDATPLPPLAAETSAEVLDRHGALLRAWPVADGRWRLAATSAAVDPHYIDALIAFEDRRFRRHSGIDPLAVLRAGLQAAMAGRIVSGASTLTMQTARLLEDGPTGSWRGKLRQARLALALERRLTKDRILDLYLDLAPFGGNVEGIAAASRVWFGKPPARLTPAEIALVVALPQSPETRRPDRHPDAARSARARVLARMERAGLIDAGDAAAALQTPVPRLRRPFPMRAPHLTQRLRDADPAAPRIVTTLDSALQAGMERIAARAAAEAGNALSIGLVVADHATGAILASVGSADLTDTARAGFVDMTQALRSPGSTLKPLIYALAFDQGLAHPETLIQDRPTAFGRWSPQNFDGRFRGPVTLREALQASLNIPAVKLTEALGAPRLMAAIDRTGVAARVPSDVPGLAVSLGGVGLSLEGLVQLAAMLARGGEAVALHARPAPSQPMPRIVSPAAAWHVGDILRDALPPPGAPRGAVAWKTGTSYGHRDAWALGWDGRHVVGVWMGRPDGTPVPGAFGGALAAPVMFRAFGLLGTVPLPPPPAETLMAGNAALPAPLRVFRGDAVDAAGPVIDFPPDGAEVAVPSGELVARVRDGVPPFNWLSDGRPIASPTHDRDIRVPAAHGPMTLAVIDAEGRAARVALTVRR